MKRAVAALLLVLPMFGCASSGNKAGSIQAEAADSGDPLYAFTLLRQGSVLIQQQRYPEALAKLSQAQQLAPTSITVYNMIGLCHMQMEQMDKAVAAFDRALELAPSFTDARNNRGNAYLSLNQPNLAEVDFIAVLADTTYPHRWEVFYNLGTAQLAQNRLAAAEESFRRAAYAPLPVFPAYLRLAEIAQRQGRGDAAIDLLEEARLKYPERMEAALELGRALVMAGRSAEARPHLEAVVASDPGSPLAEEARSLLGSG